MNFHPYAIATTLEGKTQVIPQGPVAALEIIKNLGTNGGGFFNANGAHPYENPTPLSNFFELLSIVLIPGGIDEYLRQDGSARTSGMDAVLGDACSLLRRKHRVTFC